MPNKLPRSFYTQRTLVVARELIGMHLVREYRGLRMIGRIVETEAYQGPQDLAAHSARGRTERNAVMFGPGGFAYVYLIYGMWDCVNVVTRDHGIPHAVLIRALEPVANVDEKTWGPGLLCKAMRIDRKLNGVDLTAGPLWIEEPKTRPRRVIARAPRIGIDYAGDWVHKPWRFLDRDSPYVSTVRPGERKKALGTRLKALARGETRN